MANLLVIVFAISACAAICGLLIAIVSVRHRKMGLKMIGIGLGGFFASPLVSAILDIDVKASRAPGVAVAASPQPGAIAPDNFRRPLARPEKIMAAATQAADAERQLMTGVHCFSAWDGSHKLLVRVLRETLREPSSFEHVSTRSTVSKVSGAKAITMILSCPERFRWHERGKSSRYL